VSAAAPATAGRRLSHSLARVLPLAWPLFVGQLAVLAFSTVDTIMLGRHATGDLAALSVGGAAYVTVFLGLMGVVMAVSPLAGRRFGAGDLHGAGAQFHQAVWLALGLAALGSLLLTMPGPLLALAKADDEVRRRVEDYLGALAFALPASLLFASFRGFSMAVSRPRIVMALQLGGLALKVPLNALLVFGGTAGPWEVPALGVQGCGIATALAMWAQLGVAVVLLRRDPFYARFGVARLRLDRPDPAALWAQLRLGVPMGLSILIEVTGFAFMALFIARVGTTEVAGHQICANLAALMFMLPMSLANATTTLVAQRIGAGDPRDARRLGLHGMVIAVGFALALGGTVVALRGPLVGLYTADAAVAAAALPLLGFLAVFHVVDAIQCLASFVLRAWHVTTAPMVIYAVAIWGLGLGGGWVIGFDSLGVVPAPLQGAPGYWLASTVGLSVAAAALAWLLHRVSQDAVRDHVAAG